MGRAEAQEWTLAFGAITVVITYCCHEAKKAGHCSVQEIES